MNRKFYVLCVANLKSGGPEALHQLCYYMGLIGMDVSIVYFNIKQGHDPMPLEYYTYNIKRSNYYEIEDSEENSILTAESSTVMLNGFKHIKKFIWWLSVNWFDYKPLTFKVRCKYQVKRILNSGYDISNYCNFKLSDCVHLCASKYAFEYVKSLGITNPRYLVEPISKVLLDYNSRLERKRSDIVLYNPAKPSEIMDKLLSDGSFEFKALTGFTPNQLIEEYCSAKLYVDFGHFGGPERMPKEAVYFGCCILVGLRNAAVNDFDVAIPEKFKIKDYNNLNVVKNMINDVLVNYERYIMDFNPFKMKIKGLEDNFIRQIVHVFFN